MAQSTPVYAVYSSSSPHVIYTNSVKEARAHLSTPELRDSGGRFKTFQTLEEGESFFSKNPVSKFSTPTGIFTRNEDGYRSPFAKLKPQEHSKFMKLIQSAKNDEVIECMNQNPHYYIDMSIDQPSVLHAGCRYNALHICARYDNLFIAMEIMRRIRDIKYITDIYKTPANTEETSATLIDKFLNTPDKSSGKTPLLWAARQGYSKLVMFLSSFAEAQFPTNIQITEIQSYLRENVLKCARITDCLRHPSQTYCVTLYKEQNDEDMPFIAITSRFPHPVVSTHQKQLYFRTIPCSSFTGRAEDGITSVRVSKFIDGKYLSNVHHTDAVNATSTFVPHAALGVFGEKWIAAVFYQMWASEFKKVQKDPASFRDYLSNVGVRLADSNDYFMFYSNMSGIIIPESKHQQFINKLRTNNKNDAELDLLEAMESLTVNEIKSKNVFNFTEANEMDDDSGFYTPPSTPQ